jgi:hypothetical protein
MAAPISPMPRPSQSRQIAAAERLNLYFFPLAASRNSFRAKEIWTLDALSKRRQLTASRESHDLFKILIDYTNRCRLD